MSMENGASVVTTNSAKKEESICMLLDGEDVCLRFKIYIYL